MAQKPRRLAVMLDLQWPYKRHAGIFAGTQQEYDRHLMFARLGRILPGRRPFVPQESLAMPAQVIDRPPDTVTIQIRIPLPRSLLDTEPAIQQGLNEADVLTTAAALRHFDSDGPPRRGDTLWHPPRPPTDGRQ